MSPVRTASLPEEFRSAQDLRPLHVDLLRKWNDLDDDAKRRNADSFRRQAAAAGKWIKSLEERDAVQAMIDYWTVTMANIPGDASYPDTVLLAEFSQKTVQKTKCECPFVGLNAFEVRDAPHYFGRESDVDAVLRAFETNAATVIFGQSGMGKTSLSQAGVAARLLADESKWGFIGSVLPGRDPIGALLRAVEPRNADRNWMDEQRGALTGSPDNFRVLAETHRSDPEQRLLLIVDRAEELLTSDAYSSEIAAAANALAALAGGATPGPHRVLFTIRADFVDDLKKLIGSSGIILDDSAYHCLEAPGAQALRDAIVKPGEAEGFRFDEQVVDDLVGDCLNQPDALPMLEFTLTHLWRRAEVDRVSWADYQQFPKPCQMISEMGERAYAALPSEQAREAARLAFMEMVRLGQDMTFRRMRREDLEKSIEDESLDRRNLAPVLDAFADAGLLRRIPGENRPDDRFEVSHSAVVRHWPRLHGWIDEKRVVESGRERYTAALERWRAHDRSWRYLIPLSWQLESRRYRNISRALDEYISQSRQWWGWLTLLIVALLGAVFTAQSDRFGAELNFIGAEKAKIVQAEAAATTQAREESVAAADSSRQALVADQTLLRALQEGLLSRDQIPQVFLDRLNLRPSPLPGGAMGYDPHFLAPDLAARIPFPQINRPGLRILTYPHTTVLYDTVRKLPIVVASNVDLAGKTLDQFQGVGFFADPRLPTGRQSGDRVSPVRNFGRISLVDPRQVGWALGDSSARDASFLNFQPLSVLQPWSFYGGFWSMIDRRLVPGDSKRFTILTGPILNGQERPVAGTVIPTAYWKAAIHWDEGAKKVAVQAFAMRTDAPMNSASLAQAITGLAAISKVTSLDFGRSINALEVAAVAPAEPTVYLQFAVMPRATALQISRKLADRGYNFPPEEELSTATSLAEVRFVRTDDTDRAKKLAVDVQAVLQELGFGNVSIAVKQLGWVKKQPPPATLELWLGMPQPNPLFIVYGASDGFLALRSLPTAQSELLAKMPVGDRVECGNPVEDHPGWRPCTYNGLSGFAFDAYLKPSG